ncbi:MAG: hypothetical protein ABR607_02615 [Pyrinomonadaceae bacterium]
MRIKDLWETLSTLWALIPTLSGLLFGLGSLRAVNEAQHKRTAEHKKKQTPAKAKGALGAVQVVLLMLCVLVFAVFVLCLATAVRLIYSRELVASVLLVLGIIFVLSGVLLCGLQVVHFELSAKRITAFGGGAVLSVLGVLCLFNSPRIAKMSELFFPHWTTTAIAVKQKSVRIIT